MTVLSGRRSPSPFYPPWDQGDSFSCGSGTDGWHSNAIFESDDRDPSNGIHLTRPVNGDCSDEFLPRSLKIDGVEDLRSSSCR